MPRLYYRAATFANQQEAGEAYEPLLAFLERYEELNISIYRYLHLSRLKWCVVVIGNTPSPSFQQQFDIILSTGEAFILSDQEIIKLVQRRLTESQKAPLVKKHYKKGKFL